MIETQNGKVIKVLIGQISLTKAPNVLQAVLGSCIGLAMYDSINGIGGVAHILLPDSRDKTLGNLPGKFANRAVPCLYESLMKHGASAKNIKAKIAGGSQMFKIAIQSKNNIGESNIRAVRKALQEIHIPLVSSDLGGTEGRKIELDPCTFKMYIENFLQKQRII